VDTYEGVTVKVLLISRTIGIFMDKKIAEEYGFRLQRLEKPVLVMNVDGIDNSKGMIMHKIEVNVYYKNHIKKVRIDICNLGRTRMILGILWL